MKPREGFRVYGPVLPREQAHAWLELAPGAEQAATLHRVTTTARDALREALPAVCAPDGTCRPLLVDAERDPLLHRLLLRFGEASGLPVLLHTSFNGRGDPLVRTEAEARKLAERTALDALVVERRLYPPA